MTTATAQLRALVALRWRMVRSPAAQAGLAALAACVPLALAGGAVVARIVPTGARFDAAIVAPTVFLGFALLSVVSPLTSGGGNELYPAEQLVAFPVAPATHYLTGLAVMPINLAWVSQLVIVTAATSFVVAGGWSALLAIPTLLSYVALVTLLGQATSWAVAGLRQTRNGRLAVWAVAAVAAVTTVAVARTGHTVDVLDASPTVRVVVAMIAVGSRHAYGTWAATTLALAALAVLAFAAGRAACAWSLRRPGDAGATPEKRTIRQRAPRRNVAAELRAVDRAGVWRSSSLRRGAVVLGLLPGSVAFALGIDWSTLLLLPGLVSSGAALLFGVNAFCLDAGGAVWLATLPHDPRLALRAKAWVIAETSLVCVLIAVGAALLRVHGTATAAEVTGLVAAIVATAVSVLGTSLRLSVERPHRADLRGRRDTPAPPGAMAVYSVRMAAQTTIAGLLVAGTSATGVWWAPVVAAAPFVLLGLRSIAVAGRTWASPAGRARVVLTVAAG
jgi:hypothetical protein